MLPDLIIIDIDLMESVFANLGSDLYQERPDSVSAWHRVCNDLLKFMEQHLNYKTNLSTSRYTITQLNAERIIEGINNIDKFIQNHIYDITIIDKCITTYWARAKEALDKYCLMMLKNDVKYVEITPAGEREFVTKNAL